MRLLAILAASVVLTGCAVDDSAPISIQIQALDSAADAAPLLDPDALSRLEQTLTAAIDAGDRAIAQLEAEIPALEASNASKAAQIGGLVSQIERRRREIEDSYDSNRTLCLLCAIYGCPSVCFISLANMMADDQRLQQLDRDLAVARRQRRDIEAQITDYQQRRDRLRGDLETLRSARAALLDQLQRGPAPSEALADYPELAHQVARTDLLESILGNTTDQVAILQQIRTLALAVSADIDDALAVLRGLAESADREAAASRRAVHQLLEIITAPDPAAAAARWLEDEVARRTRDLLGAMGWPARAFAVQLLDDRGPADAAARLALEPALFAALGVAVDPPPAPPPVLVHGSLETSPGLAIRDFADTVSNALGSHVGTIASARVWLDIRHTAIGDLTVSIWHGGVRENLHVRTGGVTDNLRGWFPITSLVGRPAAGWWQLSIHDHVELDQGTLVRWRVELDYD